MKKTLLIILMLAAHCAFSQCWFTYSSTNVLCNGDCTGTLTLVVTGGTPPYTSSCSATPFTSPLTITGLCAGTYQCIVMDSAGTLCSAANPQAVITEPPPLQVFLTSWSGPCDTCYTAGANVSGGTPPYIFLWSNGDTASSVTFCSGGTYTLTVQDSNGCTDTVSVTITLPPALLVGSTVTNASCDTCCNGSFNIIASGGTPPYTYSSGCNPSTNLCPGVYVCCITDSWGCTDCDTIVISYPNAVLEISAGGVVEVFPNPATNQLAISSKQLAITEIEIYDLIGQLQTSNLRPQTNSIDISSLSAGIYFVKIKTEKEERVAKFVKQ